MGCSLDNVESWLLLKSTKGLGNKLLFKAFRHFGSARAIFDADKTYLESVLGSKAINIVLKNFDAEKLKKSIDFVKSLNLHAITYEDEYYPQSLLALPDPPPVLFLKGNKNLLNEKSIGIVGSRKAVPSALNMTKSLVNNLDNVIVSGGADGIDSKAHKSTIEKGMPTISVLGFGFLHTKNKLFDEILEKNGLLLTEFLPFEKPSKFTFPVRNRIISALGDDIIIMQASSKSGALISAYWGYKLKKRVFAYIGNPVEEFEGCTSLIREGIAKLFINLNQILNDLNISSLKEEDLNPILKYLNKPSTFEEILLKTNCDEERLTLELTMLEIEGFIRKEGAYFVKNA